MELSQEEKDRIVAEEKLRFETKSQLKREHGGRGYGWGGGYGCHRGGFWKGLLVGVLACLILGFLFHPHRDEWRGGWHHHGYGGWSQQGHFGHGGSDGQNQQPDSNSRQ